MGLVLNAGKCEVVASAAVDLRPVMRELPGCSRVEAGEASLLGAPLGEAAAARLLSAAVGKFDGVAGRLKWDSGA